MKGGKKSYGSYENSVKSEQQLLDELEASTRNIYSKVFRKHQLRYQKFIVN